MSSDAWSGYGTTVGYNRRTMIGNTWTNKFTLQFKVTRGLQYAYGLPRVHLMTRDLYAGLGITLTHSAAGAVPVGFELGASMYLTIAAVLSGGLMGDHASPISDTTVLASVGADCNHLSHVTTQGAYAVLTGMVTILAYWMAGVYETPYVLFVAIIILFISMTLAMRFFGEEVMSAPGKEIPTSQ